MQNELPPLTAYSEKQRETAKEKYKVIAPYLQNEKTLTVLTEETGIAKRTLQYWIRDYKQFGLKGLIRKTRNDAGKILSEPEVVVSIEQLILKYKRNSLTSIHRMICEQCLKQGWQQPSYYQVYKISQSLSQSLKTLAHDGQKAYGNQFDLIHRREASYPNEIWQADHTLLDILVLNEKEQPERPWLTIILDDYSRAVAGYFLTFQAPSAIQTALALHQAIWRKRNLDWPTCGIPEQFYTDHGSDFTSNHLEQVAIDLKMNLVFSAVGVPRGRGKIERFFSSVNQLFLQDLPGYIGNGTKDTLLTLKELDGKLADFIVYNYHHRTHGTTKKAPIHTWNDTGFLPNMPENLESLDLLLLHVAKARKVHSDGIHFQGLRYIDVTLAAYVGETVVIRYDPRDLAEIRVFYEDHYLCTPISPEISDYTVDLKDIISARNKRKRSLKNQITPEKTLIEEIIHSKQSQIEVGSEKTEPIKSKLKRYFNE
ncbi:Mu transposase C-terminal domain-containing protein [Peribacillus castrilensis]|uniref:Transposase n=1 Tax=Peribacillus simplex TaxID=1478 RepID=A0AAN2TSZ4_9BACI|nr:MULTISPECIES: Mu transposase C-terminal domain-containing protein [Bacillaceae]MCP1096672.1 Mu transposase C-terminal domain-containing protein [Bacillaceae bacterium OS4b]MCF7622482.1 Mu transposase C-terminal domain-containing protein [Peribacillus frigoritolerans]MCT1391988.1 Mu transposase C-terminal domain-containing protein [Peribacillus frigoritolerans]NCT38362.1 DDE-type integrase/transposase/recombinase [Peribacillus frigoritolerans]PRA78426.1 transposase [Peribacillus simplex]